MLFRILLALVGTLLTIASRTRESFRVAVTRDLVLEISSRDGVAHHFVFRDRRVSSRSGKADAPDYTLEFATAKQGFETFLSRSAITRLYTGILDGTIVTRGNAFHLLWFYDLTQRVVPLAKPVHWGTPPGAYTKPNTVAGWTKRVTREPVATELDANWTGAVQQRAKLLMMRVAAGEPTKEF